MRTHRGFAFGYYSAASPREEDGHRLVDIQVIDTTRNANNWRVTDEALQRALTSLIGTPLLTYPDHAGSIMVGRFINAQKPDGYAIGTAEIIDPQAWEKIQGGEWKWVSPQVYAFESHQEDGCEVLDSFTFQHVAFVPNPAYSSTKVLNASSDDVFCVECGAEATYWVAFCGKCLKKLTGVERLPSFSTALTNILENRKRSQFQNNSGTANQSALETGKQETKKGEQEKEMSQDIAALQTKLTELSEQNKMLNASVTNLETENKTLQGKVTELESTNKTLKASLDTITAERHAEKVQKLLELRAKANLFDASKRGEEEGRLAKLSDQVLDQLIVDTDSIIKALPKPSGPKATYTAEQTIDNEERVRERLFGYRRDKEGKIVAGGA